MRGYFSMQLFSRPDEFPTVHRWKRTKSWSQCSACRQRDVRVLCLGDEKMILDCDHPVGMMKSRREMYLSYWTPAVRSVDQLGIDDL